MRVHVALLACGLIIAAVAVVAHGQGVPGGPPQAGAQAASGTGAISGTVVDSPTQKPVPGAIVTLSAAAAVPGSPPRFRGARQITDEQGRFVFTDLPGETSYALIASKFGYFDGAYGRRGFASAGNLARRITLLEGQWLRDARIELTPPASIAGTVTDEAGDPMVGVIVRAYTEIQVAGARQLALVVAMTTDDRGWYRVPNLPPGRYIMAVPSVQHAVPAGMSEFELSGTSAEAVATMQGLGRPSPLRRDPVFARDPSHSLVLTADSPPPAASAAGKPQAYPITFYPSARTIGDATIVEITEGAERQAIDIRLRPVPAFRVAGRVDGPSEAVAGLPIRLVTTGAERLGQGSESARTVAAADGTFVFLNVPAAAYTLIADRTVTEFTLRPSLAPTVSARAPGRGYTSMSSTAVNSGPPGTSFTRHSYEGNLNYQARVGIVVKGDVAGVAVPLQAGVTLRGRFVLEFSREMPAASLLAVGIIAEPANGDLSLGQPRWNGRMKEPSDGFLLEGLLPGAYVLRPIGGMVKSITWNGRDVTDLPFDTTAGKDIEGVVVTLTDQRTSIAGVVRDRAGQPVGDATVLAFPADRTLWTNLGIEPTRLRSANSASAGAFAVSLLPAGEYLLVAVDSDSALGWMSPAFLAAASRAATRVPLAWGESKRLDLVVQEVKR